MMPLMSLGPLVTMAAWVWLASYPAVDHESEGRATSSNATWRFERYPDGTIIHVRKHRRGLLCIPLRLQTELLASRLQCLETPAHDAQEPLHEVQLEALVKVSQGFIYQGPLTPFDGETRIMWDYMCYPADFFTGQIEEVWAFKNLCPVMHTYIDDNEEVPLHGNGGWEPSLRKFALPSGLECQMLQCTRGGFSPAVACCAELLSARGGPTPEDLLVLMLPACIAKLIKHERWSCLPFLGRWERVWPEWPPEDRLLAVRSTHVRLQPTWEDFSNLDADAVESLAEGIRRVPPMLDSSLSEVDSAVAVKALQSTVQCLGNISVGLRCMHKSDRGVSGRHWTGQALLSALGAMKYMSNRSKEALEKLLMHVSKLVVPKPFLKSWQASATRGVILPCTEAVRQAQITFDVSLLLHARDNIPAKGVAVYMWWDATIKKHDYLLTQMHVVNGEQDLWAEMRRAYVQVMASNVCADDPPELRAVAKIINDNIEVRTLVPVILGLRCSSLS